MEKTDVLDVNELEKVNGGAGKNNAHEQLMRISCPFCGEVFQADVKKSSFKCPACRKTIELKG